MTFPSHLQYLNDSLSKSLSSLKVYFRTVMGPEREPTCSMVVTWVKNFQTELIAEVFSKIPVRAIGDLLRMKFS